MNDPKAPLEHIMQFFNYEHLPPHLAEVSRPFHDLAKRLVEGQAQMVEGTAVMPGEDGSIKPLPRNPERTVALRKLLEAKDAAVRALVAKS